MATMMTEIYDPENLEKPVGVFGDATYQLDSLDGVASVDLSGFDLVEVKRWSGNSDICPALYHRAVSMPTHGLAWQDATGSWFQRVDSVIDARSTGVQVSAAYTITLGNNNRLAIQRAIDYCEARLGGQVVLPAGVILVSSSSSICIRMKSHVWLRGVGKDATIIKVGPEQSETAHVVNHFDTRNSKISDLCIDGNRSGQNPGIGGHGLRVGGSSTKIGCDGLTVRDVEIRDCSYGLGFQDGAIMNVLIDNCWIHETYRDAVDIKDYPSTVNSVFYPSQNIIIRDCLIERWGLSSALDDQNGIHTRSQKTQIFGNTFKPNGGGCAIYLSAVSSQGPTGAKDSIVRDNVIYLPDPAVDGVNMSGIKCYADKCNIDGNVIYSGQRGIRISGDYCTVSNNKIFDSTSSGLFASSDGASPSAGPRELTAVGNVLIGRGRAGPPAVPFAGSGIYLSSDSGARFYGGFIEGWGNGLDVVAGTLNGLANSVNFGANTNAASGITGAVRMIDCNGYKSVGSFQSSTVSVDAVGSQTVVMSHDLASTPSLIRSDAYVWGSETTFQAVVRLISVNSTTATVLLTVLSSGPSGTVARVGVTLRTSTS
ncbi:right-handed parallel beta-helix repeat-containing protein [Oryzicola mucosus]|uniref:Right handed beta helix domain-containing protein n=1 Tax=Oryzicola mucosus TaxID=2767425 RepID=A0A8J6PWJ5_9HYPH|nr:right-handed parallel beta-helix repeat-containing protein [Oryzicola mucosus]MBD0416131.1 hypothetical protein [Oryzicola mucosus]